MKRIIPILTVLLLMLGTTTLMAQPRNRHTPPPPRGGHVGYSTMSRGLGSDIMYTTFRIGLSAAHVNSDNPYLDGSTQTGLNTGVALGFGLTPMAPLFFETGLEYAEKGGKGMAGDRKTTYDLNYLEVPLVLKYMAPVGVRTMVEPYLGGYLAYGVGGKVKEYQSHTTYSSFGDGPFKRFDGGIRAGIGLRFDLLSADIGYDFGLANIGDDAFDDAHTGTFYARIGVTF